LWQWQLAEMRRQLDGGKPDPVPLPVPRPQ
jgi:hypothetical protein